jgi:hypothetical protein
MTTIADIRKLIKNGQIAPSEDNTISEGVLINNTTSLEAKYHLNHGLDIIRANLCDKLWGAFNLKLIEYLHAQNYSNEEFTAVAEAIQLDDSHWDWLAKTCIHNSDQYEWFFLDIDGVPQAACLIYHPKKSAENDGNIFYIEYVAVAPWNRNNPLDGKRYNGAGSEIIKCAMKFGIQNLGLRFGFALHSIPKAEGFYQKIGMINHHAYNKDSLNYYEMSEESAITYVEAL